MTLRELSEEYRAGGNALKRRVRELETALLAPNLTETQRLTVRQRICILTSMSRDAIATARYLHNYYSKEEER